MKIEDEIKQAAFRDDYQKAHVNLIFTANWLQQQQSGFFKQFGLTLPQFNILRILRGQHPRPATVNLLIERMLDKTSNASRIVDKLEAKQLVTRRVCPSNRRAVDIRISEDGLALLGRLDAAMASQQFGVQNLTLAEAAQLSGLLDKIRD
ncbi:MarR family winged helix-turn-helix transcriptional regulator [Hymenobacter psychrophilus]|uniref:DNA-binding transcriptional regulator, MarR family n=1 Tax=Hymenobacter psychrophilus TaxID=651662 RepID=A0A1H3ASG9_9BACT|nr:MarR family transcriptional regulator [Hymenobacter psychrophilus]SDX32652.1 DNA-binding transcriptional regulator, MarR family [Hymenobacter psychrophilus]